MDAIIITKRAYTRDREIAKKQGVHTVYTGNGEPIGSSQHKVKGTVFFSGRARSVPSQEFKELEDLGHVIDELPSDDDA